MKLNIFKLPSAQEVAQVQREEAERELLKAQSLVEYYKAMVAYRSDQLRRLTTYLESKQCA